MAEKLKILIVDDEDGMRSGIGKVLSDYKVNLAEINTDVTFEVDDCSSAEEALEIIKVDKPDIMLLDYKMGGMTGLDLLIKMSEDKIDILTIMMTAYASFETAIEATKRGAYDFLAKPFTPTELKHMIKRASSRIIFRARAQNLENEKRKVRFEFISVLSHELKSPLVAIEGYLNIMKDKILGNDLESYANPIERSLVRLDGMRKLIFDLLDMTRIESKEKRRDFSNVDLAKIAEHACEGMSFDAGDRGININIENSGDMNFYGDPYEMEIIFNNLVSNAVKYNKDNGKVDVRILSDDKKVVISVTDTGIGIAENDIKKLFKDFVRIKNKSTQNVLGSGLGLSVLKKLVTLYRGSVIVESKVDTGSTFTVELPKQQSE